MKHIYKYPLEDQQLESDGRFIVDISMPPNPVPLRVALQNGMPCLWAEVDTSKEAVMVRFLMAGTGRAAPEGVPYIGTIDIGPFVWHIYGPKV